MSPPVLSSLAVGLTGPGSYRLFLALVVFATHISSVTLGNWAVYSFFLLSGYWVTRMWQQRYRHLRFSLAVFWLSRFWRILPLFWLVNLIYLLIYPGLNPGDLPEDAGWLYGIANVALLGFASLPEGTPRLFVAWSLDIELQFYLLLPFLVWGSRQVGGLGTAGLALACLLWGLWAAHPATQPLFAHLGHYLAFFLIGLAYAQSDWQAGPRTAWAGMGVFVGIVLLCASQPETSGWVTTWNKQAPLAAWAQPVQMLLALVTAPFALWTVHRPGNRLDSACGDLSYLVYLVHVPAAQFLGAIWGHLPPMQRLPYMGATVVGVFVVSGLLWWGIDRPLNRLRSRFVRRQPRLAPEPVQPTESQRLGDRS